MHKIKTIKEADEWCKENGQYRKISFFNKKKIKTIINNAETYINTSLLLKNTIDKNNPSWMNIYINYYEALRIYVEAFLMLDKIKIANHLCLFTYLCRSYSKLKLDWNFFEKIRRKRNGANYYGETITYNDFKEIEVQINLSISIIKKEVEKRLKNESDQMPIFKAYDIRGIYPTELNKDIAYKIGRAFVVFLNAKKVLLGMDMRLSGPQLHKALVKGITDQGADVVDIGLSSTDMSYFCCYKLKTDGGIMLTASHNPKEYNGMKLFREKAIPISGATGIKEIEKMVKQGKFPDSMKKGKLTKKEMLNDFVDFVFSFVDKKKIKPFKVVMDASNGMACLIAPKVFERLKCKLIKLNFELDGSFPAHQANPFEEKNRKQLMKEVVKQKADIGLAPDGDTDRAFFIDEKGNFVPGDFLMGLMAKQMLKKKPGSMIYYDLRASRYVPDMIKKISGKPKKCRVGHAFIKQFMRDDKAIFAAEVSGHYYYKHEDLYTDNGWIPFLQILEIMSVENKKLSELVKVGDEYNISGEINFKVEDKQGCMKKIEEFYKKQNAKIEYIDGVSVEFNDWHFNVRPSNTEPLLRLNVEANTKQLLEEKKKEVIALIER